MRRGRLIVITLVALAALFVVPSAMAASADDIRDDLADNGVLDGSYTQAEINAFLRDPTQTGYDRQTTPPLTVLGNQPGSDLAAEGQGNLPFTGAEVALFAIVGLALLGTGLLLRRTARDRS